MLPGDCGGSELRASRFSGPAAPEAILGAGSRNLPKFRNGLPNAALYTIVGRDVFAAELIRRRVLKGFIEE